MAQCDFDYLWDNGMKQRHDCLAHFSVDARSEIFVDATRGWTKIENRRYIRSGGCPVIEQIAEEFRMARPGGSGRALLTRDGRWVYKDKDEGVEIQFAEAELPREIIIKKD